jgi:hypothetical protein
MPAVRAATLDSLQTKLGRGDKDLLGNAGDRRFLKTSRDRHFEIDPARVAEDARFDGLYVLRTNSTLPTLAVALASRQLWRVEQIFRTAKSILETRPASMQRRNRRPPVLSLPRSRVAQGTRRASRRDRH